MITGRLRSFYCASFVEFSASAPLCHPERRRKAKGPTQLSMSIDVIIATKLHQLNEAETPRLSDNAY